MVVTDTTAASGPSLTGDRTADISPRGAARIAGIGYLVIFVLGIFANFFVRSSLVESGDAAATAENIAASEALFRLGIVSFLVVFVVDIVVAWALYIVFRPVAREVSLLAAWFRLVYTAFLGVALVFFFQALQLLSEADYLDAFDGGQLDASALVAVDAFNYAWLIGLACFGVHLVLLGVLVVRSRATSRWLGFILVIAGFAYVTDTVAHALLANYDDWETAILLLVAVPSVIGELWLGLWLLLSGTTTDLERGTGPSLADAG